MTNEIQNKMLCVLMKSKVEIWVDEAKGQKLMDLLMAKTKIQFLQLGDEAINVNCIEGVFSPDTMATMKRNKKGDWQCEYGYFHEKGQECGHGDEARFKK